MTTDEMGTLWQLLHNIGHNESVTIRREGRIIFITRRREGNVLVKSERAVAMEAAKDAHIDLIGHALWRTAQEVRSVPDSNSPTETLT